MFRNKLVPFHCILQGIGLGGILLGLTRETTQDWEELDELFLSVPDGEVNYDKT